MRPNLVDRKMKDFVSAWKLADYKVFNVPRADIAGLVAIVYSWWLLKVLSIKWLNQTTDVFK